MQVITTTRIFYDIDIGLVEGEDEWEDDSIHSLYLEKGSIGNCHNLGDDIAFENHTVSLPRKWIEVIKPLTSH